MVRALIIWMMINHKIDTARPDECELLSELAFYSKASHGYDADFMEQCRPALTYTPTSFLCGEIWVYREENNDISGFCDIAIIGNALEVQGFFVKPERQRQGIGRKLWEWIEYRALDCRVLTIYLSADPFAVAFYKAVGMSSQGYVPSDVFPGRDLPLMIKNIHNLQVVE